MSAVTLRVDKQTKRASALAYTHFDGEHVRFEANTRDEAVRLLWEYLQQVAQDAQMQALEIEMLLGVIRGER